MVESRGGKATETKRAFGNTNSPGDAENSSCSPIPYERDNCCACNAGPMLCNRSFGVAPAVAETFPQHRQRGCGFSLMQTRRKSWGQGSPGGNGVFSLSKQLPCSPGIFHPFLFLVPSKHWAVQLLQSIDKDVYRVQGACWLYRSEMNELRFLHIWNLFCDKWVSCAWISLLSRSACVSSPDIF